MKESRRSFIKKSAFASAGTMLIPSFLKAFELNQLNTEVAKASNRILVVVQLSGGNDGLNTIVPYQNDIYYRERPTIAIPSQKVLPINDEIGFNPALEKLRPLFDEGLMTIINNVGYPNPDRSHFRSMDIWHTASASDQYLQNGWLGRYLDSNCASACSPYNVLEVDDTLSLALKGNQLNGLALMNPEKLYRQTQKSFYRELAQEYSKTTHDEHENVSYLYKTMAETISSADYIYDKANVYKTKTPYPSNELGNRLKTVAELILSGVTTSVYYVSISGFDTHVNQPGQQDRLLSAYAEAMSAFTADMKENSRLDDVMVMTFSEFGRRVKQNASNGTDHGTANNVFLINGRLKKDKVLNAAPNLDDLDEGDLKYTTDFRSIYATLLKKWLKADDKTILGQQFDMLGFV